MKSKALSFRAAVWGLAPALLGCLFSAGIRATPDDGSVLPFPPTPSASIAGPTLQESKHQRRVEPDRLPRDAPNILVILLDDVGFGLADTYGGPIHTPTLSRIAGQGISYNAFHTTAICSPTRAALLTGRNHQRVGSGTIAERAVDWDGYTGVIPRSSATLAKVLGAYGYKTAAFGKWHNTPATDTTAMGPFTLWPTGEGIGFDYFYGFLAGETSQWEPRLVENLNVVEPPHDESYHLSEDMADKAIAWMRRHRAFAPDKPFFMYWAPGAAHGPHHVSNEWADKYQGQFDDGWDALREPHLRAGEGAGLDPQGRQAHPAGRVHARLGQHPGVRASLPAAPDGGLRRLRGARRRPGRQGDRRAGAARHSRQHPGHLHLRRQRIQRRGPATGASASSWPRIRSPTPSPSSSRHWRGWAAWTRWAAPRWTTCTTPAGPGPGARPSRHTKLVASHFGGTRNPMAISWPNRIKPDPTPRSQFHHVNDIVPTIYEVLGITPPKVVDGFEQDPIDGVSLAYTFADPKAAGRKQVQYFDNNGSRGIYQDGWYACTFGPLTPWLTVSPGLATWDANKDVWELYNLSADFSQAEDLAAKEPERLAAMQALFLEQAEANKAFPIGAGIWLRIHPEDRIKTPYTSWQFDSATTRMPEFTAPGLGRESTHVTIDAELPRERVRRPLRPGWRLWRANPLHGQGPARLRVQHDDHRALRRRQRREDRTRQAPHRGGHHHRQAGRTGGGGADASTAPRSPVPRSRAPCRRHSPPASPSTWGPTWARRCPSTTSTGGPSPSRGESTR